MLWVMVVVAKGRSAFRMDRASGSSLHVLEASPAVVRLRAERSGRSVSISFQGSVQFPKRCLSYNQKRTFSIKSTSAEYNKCEFRNIGSPLVPQSQAGKFLSGVLQNEPHVLHVAAMDLLKELALDRDGAVARCERCYDSSEACLHRRIAEMKELLNGAMVEEIMYILVVGDFSKIKVPLVPRLSECTTNGRIEIWPSKDKELESVHCPEILALVKEHLTNILGREGKYGCIVKWSTAQISKLKLSRLYAASIMYGYFLMAASVRHQLEHVIARVDKDYPLGSTICVPHLERQLSNLEDDLVVLGSPYDVVSSLSPSLCSSSKKPKDLTSYITAFDPHTLRLCAKLRSQAAANIIENHSLAIFGDGDIGNLGNEEMISVTSVTFSALKRLMLEAVAFGTFLWNSEQLVDSIYRLQENNTELRE